MREAWQERALGQADLQRVKAEDIGQRRIEIRLLAHAHVLAERRREPLGERAG